MNPNYFNITITDLEFLGHHGVTPEERTLGIKMLADIEAEIEVSEKADLNDISNLMDYVTLSRAFLDFQAGENYQTLEALTYEFAHHALENFPQIFALTIQIQKPNPPTNLAVQSVGVQFSLSRE